jgi:hypothetical protein
MNTKEHQEKVRALVEGIDKYFTDVDCNALEVLNATSVISTMMARSLGMDRKTYLKDIGNMFERAIKEPEPQDE